MNIILRLLKSISPKRKKKNVKKEDIVNSFLAGYRNKDISTELERVRFADGVISNVRVNGKWVLYTSNFLRKYVGYTGMKPNAVIIIEYNIRLPSNTKSNAFRHTKHDMGMITESYITYASAIGRELQLDEESKLIEYIKKLIREDLCKYHSDNFTGRN